MLVAPVADSAQRRRKPAPKRATPAAPAAVNPAIETERAAAARRVADQIKTLSRFLYLLGGVVKTVQNLEQASRGTTSPEAAQQAERSKATVRDSIRNVQVGLSQLENEFSTKASLRPYYHLMIGVSDIAAQAAEQADAGQFDPAGQSLLKALNKLTDALAAMRQTP